MKLSGNNLTAYAKDVITSKVTVTDLKVHYNESAPWNENQIFDIALEVKVDIGKDFQPFFTIRGNYQKNETTGEITGWGSAFKIRRFFNSVGIIDFVTDNQGRLPAELLQAAIGKQFVKLDYVKSNVDGKLKYSTWEVTGTDTIRLEGEFRKAYDDTGYPKNFFPECINDPSTVEKFEYGNNAVQEAVYEDIF